VVIPAFNEEECLGDTIGEVEQFFQYYFKTGQDDFEVIVVDDGSTDNTWKVVSSATSKFHNIRAIRLPQRMGKGQAVAVGIHTARGKKILFTDADLATPLKEFPKLDLALNGRYSIAIGSRYLSGSTMLKPESWPRRFMGRAFNRLVRWLLVPGIKDTQCGFKLFEATAAKSVFADLRCRGFAFDVEILFKARIMGYNICEVPVSWSHRSPSRVRLVWDPLVMLRDIIFIRLSTKRKSRNV